jgi:hypothetical protein
MRLPSAWSEPELRRIGAAVGPRFSRLSLGPRCMVLRLVWDPWTRHDFRVIPGGERGVSPNKRSRQYGPRARRAGPLRVGETFTAR